MRALPGLLLTLLASCTPFDPADDTYDKLELFHCLGEEAYSEPRSGSRVTYITPVVDFNTQLTSPTPVPDVSLVVCTSAACDTPFADWQRLPSPSAALWMISLPFGLRNAVLRFSAPGYVPMDYVLGGPMIGSPDGSLEVRGVGVPLVSEATYSSLHSQVGTAPDPTRGTFAARVLDCQGVRAPRTQVESLTSEAASGADAFVLSNGNLASSEKVETDDRGVAGFFNVSAQTFDVLGYTSFGEVIAQTTVPVRPGVVTLAEIRPGLEVWGQ